MKKIFQLSILAFFTILFVQCSIDDDNSEEIFEGSILGRWKLTGFEDTIRYEFTSNKLFTIYGDGSGNFPTLQEFMEENPNLVGNDWFYEGSTVVVDLNFGNFSRLVPNFKCDNNVIDWTQDDNTIHSTYYRVDHDITICN